MGGIMMMVIERKVGEGKGCWGNIMISERIVGIIIKNMVIKTNKTITISN